MLEDGNGEETQKEERTKVGRQVPTEVGDMEERLISPSKDLRETKHQHSSWTLGMAMTRHGTLYLYTQQSPPRLCFAFKYYFIL